MIRRLFRRRAVAETPPATVPAGLRVYAVGDIHGRVDLLRRLHAAIQSDLAAGRPDTVRVVYLGDYVDRGLRSREVVDELLERPLAGVEATFLKGNHEAAMLRFLDDPEAGADWLGYGGQATLVSYGVGLPDGLTGRARLDTARTALQAKVPASHLDFLRRLELSATIGDYHFVHAGVRPGVPLDAQAEDDLLWIRKEFLDWPGSYGRVIVHGHTVTAEPEVLAHRIGIDTGAYSTGRLTALVLEGSDLRLLGTGR